MAKTVFRPNEIKNADDKVILPLTREFNPPVEEVEEVPEYTGPTADDLRREAEAFKTQWEQEKTEMLARAQADADQIVKNAETAAFEQVKHQTDKAEIIKNEAEQAARATQQKAQEEAADIVQKAHAQENDIFEDARKKGFAQGQEEGFQKGNEEAERLIARLHTVIDTVQGKRQEILDSTEDQIVQLVLLMTRKVVKILSENQKSVVMANVLQALKKVKGRGEVTIHVNLEDVKLTTEHTKDFIREVENVKSIHVVEDSSVEKGGCIVETDFGAINANISNQLKELETKILEINPIKTVGKTEALKRDL